MDGCASRAGRGHLAQTLQFAELALQGRRYGRRHYGWAGSGIKREHLNRWIINFRQRGNRQLGIANMPTRRIAAISKEVATGRKINGRDGLTWPCSRWSWTAQVLAGALFVGHCLSEHCSWECSQEHVPRLGLGIVRDGDCGVLLQIVEVAVGDNVAWTDPSHLGETGLVTPVVTLRK